MRVTAVIRKVISELRHISPTKTKMKDNMTVQYILKEARRHDVTDARLCRPKEELVFQLAAYECYLSSMHKARSLETQYHSKGERSIEESAHLVGLALPQEPTTTH